MAKKGWTLRKSIVFVLLVGIFAIPLLIMTLVPELYIIILFSIILGSGAWLFAGTLTPFLTSIYLKLYKKFNSFFGSSRKIMIVRNKTYSAENLWDVFYKSLSESLFPTIIAFTVVGYILRDAGTVNNPHVFVILIFCPVIVAFLIPIRILQDSKLYYVDKGNKEVISLCREVTIRLKSVGGILALGLFLFTLYTISGTLEDALLNLLVYFSFTYPTITLTSYFYYDRWHREFISDVNSKGERSGLERIAIGIFRG
ncbi:MAG: hypothetical protein ACQEQM_03260 [Thermoplasmatota archaeon]